MVTFASMVKDIELDLMMLDNAVDHLFEAGARWGQSTEKTSRSVWEIYKFIRAQLLEDVQNPATDLDKLFDRRFFIIEFSKCVSETTAALLPPSVGEVS